MRSRWNLQDFMLPDSRRSGVAATGKFLRDDGTWQTASGSSGTLDTIDPPVASVDFNGQQALNFRIENRTSDPGSPATGQIWLRTDL